MKQPDRAAEVQLPLAQVETSFPGGVPTIGQRFVLEAEHVVLDDNGGNPRLLVWLRMLTLEEARSGTEFL